KTAVATVTVNTFAALPEDRKVAWNPGVVGGIPERNQICATVDAAGLGNGTDDASATIQAAIDTCPAGQVVQLSEGTFRIDSRLLQISSGITLRGAGPGKTIVERTNGAQPNSDTAVVSDPNIVIGPARWVGPDDSTAQNLTDDGAKGATSVTIADATGFEAGKFVVLDEDHYNTGSWTDLPDRNGAPATEKIWATDRVVWARHDPPEEYGDDPFPYAATWFSRMGRAIAEIKEIAKVEGNTVTFTTPLTISYRTDHQA